MLRFQVGRPRYIFAGPGSNLNIKYTRGKGKIRGLFKVNFFFLRKLEIASFDFMNTTGFRNIGLHITTGT